MELLHTVFLVFIVVVVLRHLLPRENMMFFGPFIRPTAMDGAVALDQSTVMDVKIANRPFIYNPTFWRQYPGNYETCIKQCATRTLTYPPYNISKVDPRLIDTCAETCAMM